MFLSDSSITMPPTNCKISGCATNELIKSANEIVYTLEHKDIDETAMCMT